MASCRNNASPFAELNWIGRGVGPGMQEKIIKTWRISFMHPTELLDRWCHVLKNVLIF